MPQMYDVLWYWRHIIEGQHTIQVNKTGLELDIIWLKYTIRLTYSVMLLWFFLKSSSTIWLISSCFLDCTTTDVDSVQRHTWITRIAQISQMMISCPHTCSSCKCLDMWLCLLTVYWMNIGTGSEQYQPGIRMTGY